MDLQNTDDPDIGRVTHRERPGSATVDRMDCA